MKYFDQEMVAWRAQSGELTVMNAYCEHLGAHLGYGGNVVGEVMQCPFHGWQWSQRAATSASPTRTGPTGAGVSAPTPSSNATSRSTSGTTSSAVSRTSMHPTCSPRSKTAAARTTTTHSSGCSAGIWNCTPQYVLENGVDFAHFKFVHNTPIVPVFTRHDFDDAVSYVDFTITFEGDDGQKIEDVNSGVEAINGGLGIAVTKSWGMVDNRTISAVTPVDEFTSDVRFMVYIGRTPGRDPARAERKAGSSVAK